ncbi:MAG: leucine--tRNA ligase [Cyanobacteria bacterium]|nr:leucine--tRNA ligase [Cyanobacteriota bacterium]
MKNKEYNHQIVENKWKKKWLKDNLYKATISKEKNKIYILDMFPYPSGVGLHVGHLKGYTATDITARYFRMKGFEVLHPMGWDSFGLPTENFAIKNNKNPFVITKENTSAFRRELINAGIGIDWQREIDTSDKNYYKWNQWIFLKLYEKGLAYKKKSPVNWCPSCKTALANEQVIDGKCERCETPIEIKNIEQWFFKTTKYAEELISDLKDLDYPNSTKIGQINWIGKSNGVKVKFKINGSVKDIEVFTTKIETIYGVTFIALAPEYPLIDTIVTNEYKNKVTDYIKNKSIKTEIERKKDVKTGVFTGNYVINPINNKKIPVWISDYVLMDYGTGAVMGVPAHDKRDLLFAQIHKIESIDVVDYETNTMLVPKYKGVNIEKAKEKIIKELTGFARQDIQYKLRDWLISRERYWGTPIPIIYCVHCGEVPVSEKDLPVTIPEDIKDFRPTGIPPLAKSETFMNVKCPKCMGDAKREAKTMDTFVDSSWYYFRFTDPKNSEKFASDKNIKEWMPVDLYIGGSEHTAGHLIYSRFITKFLKNIGLIEFIEPFLKLRHQGMIHGEDGRKMSKRWGNVVSAEFAEKEYGADSLRLYEMFMGPLKKSANWSISSIIGVRRFIQRVWNLQYIIADKRQENEEILTNILIKNVEKYIEEGKYNLCVSEYMKYVNEIEKNKSITKDNFKKFILTLAPFAPFITEQLWETMGLKYSIHLHPYPEYKNIKSKDSKINIPVQINGKLRGNITITKKMNKDEILKIILDDEKLKNRIEKNNIKNIIYVENKIINIVICQ